MCAKILDEVALLIAARDGDIGTIRSQLRNGIDVEVRLSQSNEADKDENFSNGGTALNIATLYHQSEVVKELLRQDANVNVNHYTDTPDSCTPIFSAAVKGYPEIVEKLLDHGANTTCKDNWVEPTILHTIARIGPVYFNAGHLKVVELLLDCDNVDINASSDPDTPLDYAAREGNLVLDELLLNRNADINGRASPIACAAYGGHLEVVRYLLDRGADPNQGALCNAARMGRLEIVRLLLDHGADEGYMPLHRAAASGHADVVDLILNRGGLAEAAVVVQETTLHHASNAQITELLLVKGLKSKLEIPVARHLYFGSLQSSLLRQRPCY